MQITITICLWTGVGGWIINWFSIEWYYSSNLLEEFSKHEEEEEKWSFYSYIAGTTQYLFPENRTTNFLHGGIQDILPVAGRIASFFSFFDTVHFHLR